MRQTTYRLTVVAVAAGMLQCASASAATIGYWRFGDDGGLTTDSGPNGFTLSSSSPAPTQTTIPGSGNGSAFPSTIPQTGAANSTLASFTGSSNTRFTIADNAAFTDNTFTAEAFINGSDFATNGNNKSIVGHWNSSGNQRSWLFAVGNTNVLAFLYSTTGANTITLNSTLSLLPNTDYYAAVTVNMADTSANGITFYLRNLTADGPLQSAGVTHADTSLFNANTSLSIGSTAAPSSSFTGLIDEVRLSDTVLAPSELLGVPEPTTLGLAGVLGAAGLLRRRKRAL
jgi:hypothetical protein